MNAILQYCLSPDGQRAALLAGVNAAAEQTISGDVTAADLDLLTIQLDGSLTGDLRRAKVYLDREGNIESRYSYASVSTAFDAPPSSIVEALATVRARIAAEQTRLREKYAAEMRSVHERAQAEVAVKAAAAAQIRAECQPAIDMFLADASSLAVKVDSGIPYYIHLPSPAGSIRIHRDDFGAELLQHLTDVAIARRDAAEAAKAAAKSDFIRAWLAEHGVPDQIERFEAGVLPEAEYLDSMGDEVFAPLADLPRYQRTTADELREALSEDQAELLDADDAAIFDAQDASEVSAATWAVRQRILAALPGATVTVRDHRGTFDNSAIPWLMIRQGIKVKVLFGPFTFSREFAAPATAAAPAPAPASSDE